jgi:hypothetical protein
MRWGKFMRTLWPFAHGLTGEDASCALRAAEARAKQAKIDKENAIVLRARMQEASDAVRKHNEANRYDDFLKRVVQGRES